MNDHSVIVVLIDGTPAFKAEAFKSNCFVSPDHRFDFMSRTVRKLYLRTGRFFSRAKLLYRGILAGFEPLTLVERETTAAQPSTYNYPIPGISLEDNAMTQNKTSQGEDWGYTFYPRTYPHSPGHPRLDITIPKTPTGRHFDPVTVHLLVRARPRIASSGVETIRIHHPWPYESHFQACAGRIIIEDRYDKKVEAFTFGGSLNILNQERDTKCVMESPAPILELISTSSIATVLAEESEILLAERRAERLPDIEAYEQKLANVSPFDLYTTCLETLRKKHEHTQHLIEETYQLIHFIRDEIHALKGQKLWPDNIPTLAEVL
jgi:hypothetical protein